MEGNDQTNFFRCFVMLIGRTGTGIWDRGRGDGAWEGGGLRVRTRVLGLWAGLKPDERTKA